MTPIEYIVCENCGYSVDIDTTRECEICGKILCEECICDECDEDD